MVLLTPDGLAVAPGERSKMLLRSNDTVENPALVHQGSHYVLFTSEGYYGDCDYRTTWRKSRKKWTVAHVVDELPRPGDHRLCGPGGADVVVPRPARPDPDVLPRLDLLGQPEPCPRGFRRPRTARCSRRGACTACCWTGALGQRRRSRSYLDAALAGERCCWRRCATAIMPAKAQPQP